MIKYRYMSLLIVIACLYLLVPTLAQSPSEEPFYLINVQDSTGRNVPGIPVSIDNHYMGVTNSRGFLYIPQSKVFGIEGLDFSIGLGFFSVGSNIKAERIFTTHTVSAEGSVGTGCARYDFPTLMTGQTPLGMYVQLGTCDRTLLFIV